jgi:hypothetical protein
MLLAAQRPRRVAVGETHGTVRDKPMKPRSGDSGLALSMVSPLRGSWSFAKRLRGLVPTAKRRRRSAANSITAARPN